MAPAGAEARGPWILSQHDNIYLYVPNLIGAFGSEQRGRRRRRRRRWARAPSRRPMLSRSRRPRLTTAPPTPPPPPPGLKTKSTGYARVALALAAYCVSLRHPARTAALYLASFVCDELDGRAARALGQASTLGAVLDMVTDRVATACLLAIVGALYGAACPAALLCALVLVALDVSSHWFGMYAALRCGGRSHKDADAVRSSPWLVRLYYRRRLFMGACCVACEVLYLSLYLLAWPEQFGVGGRRALPLPLPRWAARAVGGAAAPGALLARALPAGLAAALRLAAARREVPLAAVLALLSVPLWLTKQACNWLQLRAAMDSLVEWDLDLRRRQRREDKGEDGEEAEGGGGGGARAEGGRRGAGEAGGSPRRGKRGGGAGLRGRGPGEEEKEAPGGCSDGEGLAANGDGASPSTPRRGGGGARAAAGAQTAAATPAKRAGRKATTPRRRPAAGA